MNNADFNKALLNIKSEEQMRAFIQQNNEHPLVKKMLQMTQGRNSMSVAENLAGSSKIPLGDFRKYLGI